ncbi:MAG: response regulator [Hyphomicrobiaceae bacterium]
MLTSRQPIWIGWGKELVYLYNDAYRSIIGGKHPWAIGRPTSEVWREIWPEIAPLLSKAMGGQEGTYVEKQLLVMERNGYPEETYYTFSYSPIPDDDGGSGGIICANTEDTARIVGERQMALLGALAAGTAHVRSWSEVGQRAAEALAVDPQDIVFALVYIEEVRDGPLRLTGAVGINRDSPIAAERIEDRDGCLWPVKAALAEQRAQIVRGLSGRLPERPPQGPWRVPPSQAVVLPILPSGSTGRAGVVVVGINPFRLLDRDYESFLGLVANQIAAAIAGADAYEEERRQAEALAELDRAKSSFFSNISHEFRTPLMLMLGPLEELLSDSRLDGRMRDRLQMAQRNGARLSKLVNALLEFSRIEAGRMRGSFQPTDLATLTADLASNFRSATEKAGLELVVDCSPLPHPVYVDRGAWERIVLNLLSNAFKFTLQGRIAVRLRASADEAVLEVQDTGIGIPEHEVPRLFERFHRIEGAQGRSIEGSGIGLALVNELVGMHGGSIAVESRLGEGSTFVVRLPLGRMHLPPEQVRNAAAESRASSAQAFVDEAMRWLPGADDGEVVGIDASAEAEPSRSPRSLILLVDDNADVRDYVRRLLGQSHDIVAVADGQLALDFLAVHRPSLILTDIMMPRVDGFQLLREIRGHPQWRDLPVIVLSARAGAEAAQEGIEAGADDYLVKPFTARELSARVDGALRMARLRSQIHEALRESELRFRTMADNAPVMVWTTDETGACTFLGRSWYDYTGQTPETGLGFGWLEATHPDDRERCGALFADANARRVAFSMEYRLRGADGSYRWMLDAATPWRDAEGRFAGYIGSVIDIMERRAVEQTQRELNEILEARVAEAVSGREQAEARLLRAQKLEAIGKLTGGIAHDFNNLLQVIGGNLQLLEKDVSGRDRAEQRLRNAISGVSRGAKLAAQLLAFGRRQPLDPKVVNLGRLVRGLDELLRRTLGEEIEIETVVGAGLWNTMVDPGQVENALLNLAINGRDAIAGSGKLTVEVGNAFVDDAYAEANDIEPGQYVLLAVSDTGSGMPPEILEHVFEPFFTTKPEGQGTGLGLSMVYGFVKQSGGHVKLYSEVGQGTTVRIYLPRDRRDEETPMETREPTASGGTETILVVEDDDEVRGTVVAMLLDLGYRVLKARDAQSAFAIVESGMPIDLLFTDVVMPGPMRSTELARQTRERSPATAILFTSGYTDNAIVHGGRLDEGVELLSKPYSREQLARRVRQVLKRHAASRGGAPGSASPPAAAPSGTADGQAAAALTVLAVEDEALILMATTDMLEELGHTVLAATSGRAALALLDERGADVLLTDVGLPDMTGVELARSALARQPGLPVVFATGHASVAGLQAGEPLTRAERLSKPFSQDDLSRALQHIRPRAEATTQQGGAS